MRPEIYNTLQLVEAFSIEKVLTLESVGRLLGNPSKRTIIRKLNSLRCRASYSHAGKYYTLDKEANYTPHGIWSFNEIHFSKYGTLVNTILHLVTHSKAGCLASELRSLLHVRVHNALAKLYASKRLTRERIAGEYLYLSPSCHALQLDKRHQLIQNRRVSDEPTRQASMQNMIEENMCFLLANLDERQKRLYLGLESIKVGHGGDAFISQITGVNVKTIARGRRELQSKDVTQDRIRRAGAGRPALKKTEVIELLNELMEESTAGDPMSRKKWSRKDTRSISEEMKSRGIDVCPNTVGELLKDQDYSLRVNRKTIAETHHPDRNQQFEFIAETRKRFEDAGDPVLSVDTKKKELVGNFKNAGKTWNKRSEEVLVHDFRSDAQAKASPYGLYDTLHNRGTVVVGTSADTPEFAVDCLDLWITEFGWSTYPNMKRLLLLCDSGGSNGYRPRLWKYKLYKTIAQNHGINVTVCHYPPGASKWNPVEHRLFSFISMEWAGYPLRSIDLMLDYIRGTTTKTGLEVTALLNPKNYVKGIKVSKSQFNEIGLHRDAVLPKWNYTITPNPGN